MSGVGNAPITDARRIERDERIRTAVALRVGGATFQQIANQIGVGVGTAYKYVRAGLKITREEIAKEGTHLAALEVERLERLWRAVFPLAVGDPARNLFPNLHALDRCLRIIERKSRILGLDAPAPAAAPGEAPQIGETHIDILIIHGEAPAACPPILSQEEGVIDIEASPASLPALGEAIEVEVEVSS